MAATTISITGLTVAKRKEMEDAFEQAHPIPEPPEGQEKITKAANVNRVLLDCIRAVVTEKRVKATRVTEQTTRDKVKADFA